jgi:hypothetical protein
MLQRIIRYYFWDGLRRDMKKYICFCTLCQKTKARYYLPYSELAVLLILKRLWQEISVDFITSLPHSKTFKGKIAMLL